MDKVLKIKLFFVLIVFVVSALNYKQILIQNTDAIYSYDNISFMVVSICFGVIMSTSIYNLTLYWYLRSKQHLYYALAQIFTIMFLVNLDSLFIKPFDEIFGLKSIPLFNISQIFMLVFSLLFIKEFLKNYHNNRKLEMLINVIIYIALFDFLLTVLFSYTIFTKFIPIFVPIWLVLSEARRAIEKKDIPFYYILFGWGTVLFVVALEYIGFVKFSGIVFPFLHVALALDAILLSIAISYKFKLIEDDRHIQQTLLLQQSRMASMGEMISIVAHQWRQPLTFLSFTLMNIKKKTTGAEVDIKEASKKIQYMSKTIENFRNFYNPSKIKERFDIKQACEDAVNISNVSVNIEEIEPFSYEGNKNEFEQVILNIINNAKDAKKDAVIKIIINKPTITIIDDAGGIDEKYLENIFEPYFTTKEGNDGIGLYIVKMIVEKEMKGKVWVESDKKIGVTKVVISLSV